MSTKSRIFAFFVLLISAALVLGCKGDEKKDDKKKDDKTEKKAEGPAAEAKAAAKAVCECKDLPCASKAMAAFGPLTAAGAKVSPEEAKKVTAAANKARFCNMKLVKKAAPAPTPKP